MTTEEQALNTVYRRARLRFALAKMNDDYQRLIVILFLMGWKQVEIAEVCDVSKQMIQQHVAMFLKRNGLVGMGRGYGRK